MGDFLNYLEKCGHLGHLMVHCFQERPNVICQIDASTGEKETNESVLSRSIQLAKCFRRFGLQPGDVLSLSGINHLDIHIPFYAGLMNGLPVVGIDLTFKYDEIKALLKITEPKIAFCQQEVYEHYVLASAELRLDLKIVTFDEGEHSMKNFIEEYEEENSIEFSPAEFNEHDTYAWLVSTSGTTGNPKVAAITHHTIKAKIADLLRINTQTISSEPKMSLNMAPMHWISGFFNATLMPVTNQIKVQTSAPVTPEHLIDIINRYKPKYVLTSPALLSSVLNLEKSCDWSCFDNIALAGCKTPADLLVKLRKTVRKDAAVMEMYGQTENLGPVLQPALTAPLGSCGRAMRMCLVKIVNTDTGEEILSPYENGELWCKGLRFKEYYRNPEETAKAITEDGWYKTGDIFYKDDRGYFYFVERLKMLIKFRNYHIAPVELEEIIRTHPSILDVCVTSVEDAGDGEHPVACVVRRPGCDVTAQEIKELVASKLSSPKHLRGGVVFMEDLPYTSTGKLARAKLRTHVKTARRE